MLTPNSGAPWASSTLPVTAPASSKNTTPSRPRNITSISSLFGSVCRCGLTYASGTAALIRRWQGCTSLSWKLKFLRRRSLAWASRSICSIRELLTDLYCVTVYDLDVLRVETLAERLDQVIVQADAPGVAKIDLARRPPVRIDDGHRTRAAAVRREQLAQPTARGGSVASQSHGARKPVPGLGQVEHGDRLGALPEFRPWIAVVRNARPAVLPLHLDDQQLILFQLVAILLGHLAAHHDLLAAGIVRKVDDGHPAHRARLHAQVQDDSGYPIIPAAV